MDVQPDGQTVRTLLINILFFFYLFKNRIIISAKRHSYLKVSALQTFTFCSEEADPDESSQELISKGLILKSYSHIERLQ